MGTRLAVRCPDRTVFAVDRTTLDPLNCGSYDAYCFTDPAPDTEYISYSEWVTLRNQQWDKMRYDYYQKAK